MKLRSSLLLACFAGVVLNACGGAGSVTGGSSGSLGSFSYSIVGAAQPPVTASSAYGPNVTAIAGGTFDRLTVNYQGPLSIHDTRIAFCSNRTGAAYEIYTMKFDGTDVQRLTNNSADDGIPVYSPDGSKIAFQTNRDGNYEIYVMNADGTGQTRITNNTAQDAKPGWSPDGTKIVFSSDRDGNYEIYRMNADGTSQSRLTNNAATEYDPTWSPDGDHIVFYSNRDGNTEIYRMGPGGSGITRLTTNTFNDVQPSVNNENKILFASDRDGNYELYTMNIDGTGVVRVTNNPSTDFHPEFSKDGKRIVFYSTRQQFDKIFSTNQSGGDMTLHTDSNASYSNIEPTFSPPLPRSPQTLVGAAGPMGTAAAGFFYCQEGTTLKSVVTFDTTSIATRANARVTSQSAQSGETGSNLIFTISTSAGLANVKYADFDVAGKVGTAVSPTIPAGSTGALLSFDSSTGLVASVLPFTVNRGIDKGAIVVGDEVHISKSFTAVYNGKGKNLAPNGATEVIINRSTGELIRVVKN